MVKEIVTSVRHVIKAKKPTGKLDTRRQYHADASNIGNR